MEHDFETRVVDLDDVPDDAAAAGGDRRKVYAVGDMYGSEPPRGGDGGDGGGARFKETKQQQPGGGATGSGGTASFRGAAELVIAANRVKRMSQDTKIRRLSRSSSLSLPKLNQRLRSALDGAAAWHGLALLCAIAAVETRRAAGAPAAATAALRAGASLACVGAALCVLRYYRARVDEDNAQALLDMAPWTLWTWPGRGLAAFELALALAHPPPGLDGAAALEYACGVAGPLTRGLRCRHGIDELLVLLMIGAQAR